MTPSSWLRALIAFVTLVLVGGTFSAPSASATNEDFVSAESSQPATADEPCVDVPDDTSVSGTTFTAPLPDDTENSGTGRDELNFIGIYFLHDDMGEGRYFANGKPIESKKYIVPEGVSVVEVTTDYNSGTSVFYFCLDTTSVQEANMYEVVYGDKCVDGFRPTAVLARNPADNFGPQEIRPEVRGLDENRGIGIAGIKAAIVEDGGPDVLIPINEGDNIGTRSGPFRYTIVRDDTPYNGIESDDYVDQVLVSSTPACGKDIPVVEPTKKIKAKAKIFKGHKLRVRLMNPTDVSVRFKNVVQWQGGRRKAVFTTVEAHSTERYTKRKVRSAKISSAPGGVLAKVRYGRR